MLVRLLIVLLCFVPLIGCGGGNTPEVLDQNTEKDPVVSDDYEDATLEDTDPTKFE